LLQAFTSPATVRDAKKGEERMEAITGRRRELELVIPQLKL